MIRQGRWARRVSVIDAWQAALAVAGGLFLAAGIFALVGRTEVRQAVPPAPVEAKESIKQDVEWAKAKAKAARQ